MSKIKLNNLLCFQDFTGELPKNKQKKTKRTDVGLDILNERRDINHSFDHIKELLNKFDLEYTIGEDTEGNNNVFFVKNPYFEIISTHPEKKYSGFDINLRNGVSFTTLNLEMSIKEILDDKFN